VVDASGFYRSNSSGKLRSTTFFAGPRFSATFGRWRPFVHAMAGIQMIQFQRITYDPIAIDVEAAWTIDCTSRIFLARAGRRHSHQLLPAQQSMTIAPPRA